MRSSLSHHQVKLSSLVESCTDNESCLISPILMMMMMLRSEPRWQIEKLMWGWWRDSSHQITSDNYTQDPPVLVCISDICCIHCYQRHSQRPLATVIVTIKCGSGHVHPRPHVPCLMSHVSTVAHIDKWNCHVIMSTYWDCNYFNYLKL